MALVGWSLFVLIGAVGLTYEHATTLSQALNWSVLIAALGYINYVHFRLGHAAAPLPESTR
jgi:hypothetical protein